MIDTERKLVEILDDNEEDDSFDMSDAEEIEKEINSPHSTYEVDFDAKLEKARDDLENGKVEKAKQTYNELSESLEYDNDLSSHEKKEKHQELKELYDDISMKLMHG